ncbi:MAG: hypothetical protein NVSMB57_15910 [Actinomycetota bacterium]
MRNRIVPFISLVAILCVIGAIPGQALPLPGRGACVGYKSAAFVQVTCPMQSNAGHVHVAAVNTTVTGAGKITVTIVPTADPTAILAQCETGDSGRACNFGTLNDYPLGEPLTCVVSSGDGVSGAYLCETY